MRRVTQLDELKSIELDILKAVHRFCCANNLKYSLAYGTLLGAIRHKGFIPWDDDIDIMMPRKDYELFIKSFQHPYYRVYDCNNSSMETKKNERYYLPFAKVADKRTLLKEDVCYSTFYGVYIDVFPIDEMPDNPLVLNRFFTIKRIINAIATLKIVRIGKRNLFKNLVLFIGKCFLAPIPITLIGRSVNRYSQKYNEQGYSRAAIFVPYDNTNDSKWIVDKGILIDTTLMQFEGNEFYCPIRYDEYLTDLYGEWRKLPPVEKRISHHAFNAWYIE